MTKVVRRLLSVAITAAVIFMPVTEVSACEGEQILLLVNAERAKNNLSPYVMDKSFCDLALVRAREQEERFSHTRPDNSEWYTVSPLVMSENIAKATSDDGEIVVSGWMQSESHKANVLASESTRCGIATYQSNGMTYTVMLTN